MEVIFGGVIVFALEALEATVEEAVRGVKAPPAIDLRVTFLAGACCMAFLLYDVGIYHLLTRSYPFQRSWTSVGRFCLDIVMTACLFLIVVPVMHKEPEGSTITVLMAATAWHLFAALWHLLASRERDGRLPLASRFLPHFVFPVSYWLLTLGVFAVTQERMPSDWRELNRLPCLLALCGTMLLAAVARTFQMIRGEMAAPLAQAKRSGR
jgi:hypothetical protein